MKKFYVLPTQSIYVFYMDLRTKSDYFPYTALTDRIYNRDGVCLLCGTGSIYEGWNFNSGNYLFTTDTK